MIITVDSSKLKNAFKICTAILRGSELSKSIAFTTDNHMLYITLQSSVFYQCAIDIKECSDYVNTTITVVYTDLDKLLAGIKTTKVIIQEYGVRIENPGIAASMGLSNSVVVKREIPVLNYSHFDFPTFSNSMKKIIKGGLLDKLFAKSYPVLCYDDYMGCRYPSVWIRTSSCGIKGIYQKEYLKYISNLSPSEYCEYQKNYYFKDGNSILIIPVIYNSSDTLFTDKISELNLLAEFNIQNLSKMIEILKMVAGNTVRGEVLPSDFVVSVRTHDIELSLGTETPVFVFELQSEVLLALLSILEDEYVKVLRKDSTICFQTQTVSILIRLPD